MSWDVVKKAINSNLNVPLNEDEYGNKYVPVYYKVRDMFLLDVSEPHGGTVYKMGYDNEFIYVGGLGTIKKYRKDDMSLVATGVVTGSTQNLIVDGDFIFFSYAGTLTKYNKNDFSVVSTTYSITGVTAIVIEGDFIYVATNSQTIKKYNKNTFELLATSPAYGGALSKIAVDGDFVYVIGATVLKIRQYNKNTLSYTGVESVALTDTTFSELQVGTDNIYVSGSNGEIRFYNKTTLAYVGTKYIGTPAQSILIKDGYIYYSSGATNEQILVQAKEDGFLDLRQSDTKTYPKGLCVDSEFIYSLNQYSQKVEKFSIDTLYKQLGYRRV